MINIQELLAASKAKGKTISLLKGGLVFIQWSPDLTIAKSVLILVLLSFVRKQARNKLSSLKSFKELSNWYGGNLTKQGDMLYKNSYPYFLLLGKALINFLPSGFSESGIHYVPMGMALR